MGGKSEAQPPLRERALLLLGLASPTPPGGGVVVFVAPPWGTALRRTVPPITDVIDRVVAMLPGRRLFVVQAYETLDEVEARLHRTRIQVYGFNAPGRNMGCSWVSADGRRSGRSR
jgi:hypothetical protein